MSISTNFKNVIGMIRGLLLDGIYHISGSGAPVDGASGTGVNLCGKGSTYTDVSTGYIYTNMGTSASPKWYVQNGIVELEFTNAQVLNMRATPLTLLAAPGAGKVIQFLEAMLFFDFTAVYTAGAGDDMAIRYNNAGTMTSVSDTIEATGFLTNAADIMTNARPKIDAIATKVNAENMPLVLHNTGGAEFGGGNAANLLRVKVLYNILPTGF